MNKERLEELHTRALDGRLTPEDEKEYAAYLKEHPDELLGLESYKKLRADLRANIPVEQEPPFPDFFNSHLRKMIEDSEQPPEPVEAAESWFGTFGSWLVPAAAAAILAFFAGMQINQKVIVPAPVAANDSANVLPAVYSPIATVSAQAVRDQGLGGAVIILEGLEALPDSLELVSQGSGDGEDRAIASIGVTF